ncbi:CDP-alcohol phosphatidyltransferase family protein [Sphingomonas quercus]|uniref:Phosphatidylcholine/phosphatidylserine synthase n=1 Tax=Sphingomonas quercus TaxID=2842451 RepID=A0ABS6BFE4_9SPHN|nr:phosphatidylcholine/phosphatidylserine synthase [Sphingomonas quercus]
MSEPDPEARTRWRDRAARGIPLRAVAPNAVTALALCFGLSGIRFAVAGEWERAVATMIVAGVLDGVDGRIARLLKGESRFGAELDSLSDVIAFGVAPSVVIYLWSLQALPRYGWLFALAHALCCALRLARFNAQIEASQKPHKAAGFLTGVPAPAGAGVLFLPIYLWLATGMDVFREIWVVAPWTALTAFLLASSLPTYSWGSLRLRRGVRFGALVVIAMIGAALISAPWETLTLLTIAYVLAVPFSVRSYARFRRLRAARPI